MERTIFHIDVNSAFLSWTAVDMLEHGETLDIRTIGELAATDPEYLKQEFKSHGQLMWEYANGIADNQVITEKRELFTR